MSNWDISSYLSYPLLKLAKWFTSDFSSVWSNVYSIVLSMVSFIFDLSILDSEISKLRFKFSFSLILFAFELTKGVVFLLVSASIQLDRSPESTV